MGEEKKRWGWWQKVALASLSVLLIFVGILVGGRRAWIEPLPGIRIEMTRPFLRESDLGPESAYLLLLEAIEPPVEASRTRKAGKARKLTPEEELFGVVARPAEQERPIWGHDWTEALGKLAVHPWPRQPPPAPAPVEKGNVAREEAGGGMGGEFPSPVPADAPWTLAQYQDIQRLRELYEPKVAILDRALADPNPQVPTIDSWDFPLSYLSNARALTRWVALSAQCKAAEGDAIGACQDIDRALGMAGLVSRGGRLDQPPGGLCL